ncbi:hypothetical protein [Sphingomonas radiodurans]|uniref:hypothetical protein n=1 Tax=Sphingomonas radiodurans TaxID=2890321 RepID=UPI001E2E85CA|nr:hypothetical protein [Sphingomonas radiodurans]WBH17642.1 hypothetical protein LLW23_05945 [Sphingomonas radiodurans]
MAKLKVYRTPAGFYDAYVAAPSQKAALAAWGSDANLFTRGLAEIVSDPELTAEPLANPGAVIRRMRTAEDEPEAAPTTKRPGKAAAAPAPKRKPKPKPSRAALDDAEAAIEAAETRQAEERRAQKSAEEALAAKRRALDKAHAEERIKLDRARIAARDDYDAALDDWRDD